MPDSPSDVLGALPRSRPHRRSDKRASRPTPESGSGSPAPAAATGASAPATAKPAKPKKPKPAAAAKPKAAATAKAKAGARTAPAAQTKRAPAQTTRAQFYTPSGAGSRVAKQKASKPVPDEKFDVLGTAIQAAAELAEIGISATARAIRGAVERLPRP
jgi:hypothetical protein